MGLPGAVTGRPPAYDAPGVCHGMLRPGSRGAAVLALQRRLAELGWYAGEVDGIYGELTEDAVRALQRAFRLHVDGVAGPEVMRLLDDPLLAAGAAGARHLLVGWGDAPPEPGCMAPWLSAWASPWMELAADLLGRIDPGAADLGKAGPPANGPSPDRAGAPPAEWLPIVTLRPSRTLVAWRRRDGGPLALRVLRRAPLRRIVVASPAGLQVAGRSGDTELPPPGASRLARRLRAAGVACWLSLRLLGPARPATLVWWGYEVARRTAAFERLIVWAPGPGTETEAALAAVRAALRGIRRWRPPCQVLLGLDLSPWLVEPGHQVGPAPARRLTQAEAVLASWQIRTRRLRGERPEELPVLLRCTPERVRAFVRLARWAGLGGMALEGVDQADAPALAVIESGLAPLKFSRPDDPS